MVFGNHLPPPKNMDQMISPHNVPRIVLPTQSGTPSRSSIRQHLISEDILFDLTPEKTIDTLSNRFDHLNASLAAITPNERAFGLRVAVASKKIQEWYDELSGWPWPKAGGFDGCDRSSEERVEHIFLLNSSPRSIGKMDSDCSVNIMETLTESQIHTYEIRIDEIIVAIEDLRIDEIKRQVFDTHFSAKSRPSSSISTSQLPDFLTSSAYVRMDDFTAIVTVITLKILPKLNKLSYLLDAWIKRISILRKIPKLVRDLEDAEIAMQSGWNTIPKFHGENTPTEDKKLITLTREAFDVIRHVLQQKIMTIGHSIDTVLDILEGSQDTLPESWLDRMEALVQDYGEWVVVGESRVIQGEWLDAENNKNLSNENHETATDISDSKGTSENRNSTENRLSTKNLVTTDSVNNKIHDTTVKFSSQENSSFSNVMAESFLTEEGYSTVLSDAVPSHSKANAGTNPGKINQSCDHSKSERHLGSEISLTSLDKPEAKNVEQNNTTKSIFAQDEEELLRYSFCESISNCGSISKDISDTVEPKSDSPSKASSYSDNSTASLVPAGNNNNFITFNSHQLNKNQTLCPRYTHHENSGDALDSRTEISPVPCTSSSKAKSQTYDPTDLDIYRNEAGLSDISGSFNIFPTVHSSDVTNSQKKSCDLNNTENENLKLFDLTNSADGMFNLDTFHINLDKPLEDNAASISYLIGADTASRNETGSESSSILSLEQQNFNESDKTIPKSLLMSNNPLQPNYRGTGREKTNTLDSIYLPNNADCLPQNLVFSTDGCVESCFEKKPLIQKEFSKFHRKVRSVRNLLSKIPPRSTQLPETANSFISNDPKTDQTIDGVSCKRNSLAMACKTAVNNKITKTLSTSVRVRSSSEASADDLVNYHSNISQTFTNIPFPPSMFSKTDIASTHGNTSIINEISSIIESPQTNFSITYQRFPSSKSSRLDSTKLGTGTEKEEPNELLTETRLFDKENCSDSSIVTAQSPPLINNYLNKGKMSPVLEEAFNASPKINIEKVLSANEDTDANQKHESLFLTPCINTNSPHSDKSVGFSSEEHQRSLLPSEVPSYSDFFDNLLDSTDTISSNVNTNIPENLQIEEQSLSSRHIDYAVDMSFDISPPDSPLMRASKSRSISFGPELAETFELPEHSRFRNDDSYIRRKPIPFVAAEATKNDQLERQISSLLKSMPSLICLSSEAESVKCNPENLQPREARPKTRNLKKQTSSLSIRSSTSVHSSTITLSPVFGKSHSRPRYQNFNSEIRVYHLSRSTGEAPIKLFVRLVGEHGERVMVRVGGGWADLGEYLREYASHHGRRSVTDTVKVQEINSRKISSSAHKVSSINWENGRSSPYQRPQSVIEQRPRNNLSIPKTRKPTGGTNAVDSTGIRARKNSFRCPSTPISTTKQASYVTPPSAVSSNGTALSGTSDKSSRMSWIEEEFNLGLAGPRSKKCIISDRDLEWVESMKEKVRLASAEKDRRHRENFERTERSDKLREYGPSLGDFERGNGSKRLFRRDGSIEL